MTVGNGRTTEQRIGSTAHARGGRGGVGGLGLLLALLSSTTFGTSGSFASSLLGVGWTPGAAVTARVSLAAVVMTVPALLQLRGRWAVLRRNAGQVLLFGLLAVAGAQLFYFNAVAHLSVGVALLLEYLGTILVVLWLWIRRGQRPRRLTVAGAVVAMAGLVLVLNLLGSHHLDPVGVLWGLAAAVGLAAYFLISAGVDDQLPPLVLAWAGLAVGAFGLVIAALVGVLPIRAPLTDVILVGHRTSWIVPLAGLSIVAAVVAYVAGIGATRLLGAKVASFVGLTEVVAAVLFAWLLLGQVPTGVQLAGGLLIIGGVALVRIDEFRNGRETLGVPPVRLRADQDGARRGR